MLKGLLGALRGVADHADFIPGFDPVKDRKGLVSQLLSGQGGQQAPQMQRQQMAPGGAFPQMQAPQPSDYMPSYNFIDMLNPFKDTVQMDRDGAAAFKTAQDQFSAAQALEASKARDEKLNNLLIAAGLNPQQIAQVKASNMLNADETGKNLAANLGPTTLGQGDLRQNLFAGERYNPKTATPISEFEQGITERETAAKELTAQAAMKRANRPTDNGITIGADGTVQIGGPAGAATTRQMAGQDASQLADARKRANDLQPVLNTMYAARAELLGPDGVEGTADDLDTGSFAPIMQAGRRFIPGEQADETRYDNFDALSKEFGIEKLAGIGGNDTERELLTAIQTGPNTGAQEGSNLSRLNRQIGVFEFIGESRRNFMARWQADHGSLSRIAQNGPYSGMTFDEALSVFQREEAQRQGLLGAATAGASDPDATVGITPQQGDLSAEEYQELLRLRQEVGG
jgi:hypothetical protein